MRLIGDGDTALSEVLSRRRAQLCLLAALALSTVVTWNLSRASLRPDDLEAIEIITDALPNYNHTVAVETRRSAPTSKTTFPPPPSSRAPSPTTRIERLGDFLRRRYIELCHRELFDDADQYADLAATIQAQDEFRAIQLGTEMWNRLGLDEIDHPTRYYATAATDVDVPFTVLSYGRRLDQGRALLARIGAAATGLVSFPSVQAAFDARPYLSQFLFRQALDLDWARFQSEFSGKEFGYLLSTLNQWTVLERLRNGTYPDPVFVVEDDVLLVPDFQRKFRSLLAQLAAQPWEVVFVGTCHQIKSAWAASANLFVADASRCFNAVLLRRSAAVKILDQGAVVDRFRAVDHLFNIYIPLLNLTAFYVYPPLAYEQSKNDQIYSCFRYLGSDLAGGQHSSFDALGVRNGPRSLAISKADESDRRRDQRGP